MRGLARQGPDGLSMQSTAWDHPAMRQRAGARAPRRTRVRLLAEIRSLKRRLAARGAAPRFLKDAGEAVLVIDPASGRVLRGNARACQLTGLSPAELRQTGVGKLVEHPLLDEAGVLDWLAGRSAASDDEAFLRGRQGEVVPVSLSAARVKRAGRPAIRVVARDVTRERRALWELRQAKETLAALGLAGAHLMVETDQRAVYGVICRELLRLGFHSAVLEAEHGGGQPHPPCRYVFTS